MVASAPSDFTEMVNMGMHLEEGVREGRLSKDEGSSKRYGAFKKKDGEAHVVQSHVKSRRPSDKRKPVRHASGQHQVAHIAPVFRDNSQQYQQPNHHHQQQPQYQQQHRPQQQAYQPRGSTSNQANLNYDRKKISFDPIPMQYAELYPSLIERKLVTPREPPVVPANPQWWYKPDQHCVYHSGAPGHNIENCYPLKTKVQDLMRCGILSFEDSGPNVTKNPLPEHEKSVNMVQGCPGKYKVKFVSHIRQSLVELHRLLCQYNHIEHDHDRCRICSVNRLGCRQVGRELQELLDEGTIENLQNRNVDEDEPEVNLISPVFKLPEPVVIRYDGSKPKVSPSLVIKPAGPVPYSSDKVIPFRYNPVAVEDGKELSLPSTSVVNIADVSRLTRSGRVFSAPPKPHVVSDSAERPVGTAVNVPNPTLVAKPSSIQKTPVSSVGPSGIVNEECDEMLRLIKKSEYNVVDQLLQTPSKISVLSLLLNSEPHREALQKVLDLAYVDHDVTIEQFDSIVANITACNTLSFCDADLPAEGRDHNLAFHISMNCKTDAMSNSGVVVKAFDGSRKTVIGEVDLPIKIGPSDFQVTFQVMDIHPSYSCLLGRPWIHEAGAVTSTLHQKLKFVKNKKLVVVGGEKALLVSHLSSFSYIDAEDEVGTPFQALSVVEPIEKKSPSFASYRDAKLAIECGAVAGLGKMIELEDNKSRAGIAYSSGVFNEKGLFKSGGFIHADQAEEAAAILEEDTKDLSNFVIPGGICHNWVAVDVPTVIHKSALILKPIEHNDPTPSPNFEFHVFEAEEDDVEGIPDEISRLLEHEKKIIQPHLEDLETVNLGSEGCVRMVKIGALLEESVKKGLITLLREYSDIFAWSYEEMPGLDTDIVQHFLPLKPECVPVKQKLRRTHPDMAVKIKEEVHKQIDAGFLVTSIYPLWVANIVPVPKKDGKVRMCVDYRDLNKASPKDDFPLPHIDMLVDNTAKFKVFSFMDGFSGYNQIKMAPEDMEKTTFITP
ncbi:hypothetical protein KIW84_034997 [Lathyrus oleraceus]|uniref:Reverse transcriptase domain-containing protein n=1 Tax=Pisum sativum TaxID=3888 RepID=A0A9D4XZW9_PEA|nr:hypothetical protein KIW84_034997 [Pisum sativum]